MQDKLLGNDNIPRLGLGCWAIGGPFFDGDIAMGYGAVDDRESLRAIATAVDLGVRLFDTADVYGAGHSETLLGKALGNRDDVMISSKVGCEFDSASKQLLGENVTRQHIEKSITNSLRRLQREKIDLLFLHLNVLPIEQAHMVFDTLDKAVNRGNIGAYGWSTDYPSRALAMVARTNFQAVQHAMNVFFDASAMIEVTRSRELLSFIRSPLAMGLLTGKFDSNSVFPATDVRNNTFGWMDYFKNGKVVPAFAQKLDQVKALLCSDGRTLAQGSLSWLWAKSANVVPLPGFRLASQVEENIGAWRKGPLSDELMKEIEQIIRRPEEDEIRER